MADANLPIWALVVIPLGSAAVGALSGPVTEKLRAASEARVRQADRDAIARANSATGQQATIIDLQDAMNELEVRANATLTELAWTRELHEALGEALNRADALRVRLTDQESRELVQAAMNAVTEASMATSQKDPRDIGKRIETATEALQTMNERLGIVYRSFTP